MKRLFALFLVLWPAFAAAQSWPVYENVYVNDYANVIEEGAEQRIMSQLKALREETGVEATVLTIYTRWGFESTGSLENFATGLFNHWGIGNAERNDGILILVVSEDREMRVELGSGYGTAFDREAKDIIDRVFLPEFRDGDFSTGIEAGTDAVIQRIARVQAAGEEPAGGGAGGGGGGWIFGGFAALFAGVFALAAFGGRIRDRFSRCPSCGKRGIRTRKNVLEKATRTSTGKGERDVTCPHCNYHDTVLYTIPRITRSSSSSGGSFGGGSSSGGGASGRW
ncbi:TPM domain-containing protein [Maritimibacter fusiformis]|uniref:TPM domain-containing protein n=1 Tax=Maritimibacter fusiformis TaxID=2603819 RepID=A0A5D0RKK3_9RHOB|nr:TPM domain-containing protein [Maritimibacter fusiformis]TYB81361.1 TPM domain-containing protein [Maritimibacter fusiformis]